MAAAERIQSNGSDDLIVLGPFVLSSVCVLADYSGRGIQDEAAGRGGRVHGRMTVTVALQAWAWAIARSWAGRVAPGLRVHGMDGRRGRPCRR